MGGKINAIEFDAIAPTMLNTSSISVTAIATPTAIRYKVKV